MFFADSGSSEEEMAENILALRQAGCRVIVDDITYWAEPVFQDGPIAQAVNDVVDDGCVYLSSAGNNRINVKSGGNTLASIWESKGKARAELRPARRQARLPHSRSLLLPGRQEAL